MATSLLFQLIACGSSTSPVDDALPGLLGYPDNLSMEIPDSVAVGQDFAVSVRTLGPDGCWRVDRTEVEIDGLVATIIPYDIRSADVNSICTHGIIDLDHTATLAFATAGLAEITIQGRDGTVTRPVMVE